MIQDNQKYKVTVTVPGHRVEVLTILAPHACEAIQMGLMGVFQNPENSKAVPGLRITAEAMLQVVGGVAA